MTDADRLASRQNLSVIDAVQATSFRAGDHVEIRSAAEILSTLDDFGMLDGVPFMPEMLPFVGQRFRVASRALKVCSAIGNTHMRGIVFLEQLRGDVQPTAAARRSVDCSGRRSGYALQTRVAARSRMG